MHLPKFLPIFIFCAVLACAAVISPGGHGQAQADTGTPTPTPETVPLYSSTITVTYTYRGTPFLTAANPLSEAFINGEEDCGVQVSGVTYLAIQSSTVWPWQNYPPCNEVGLRVRLCDRPSLCSDEFTYNGLDVHVDIPYPEIPGASLARAHFEHEGVPQTVTVTSWSFESGVQLCNGDPALGVLIPPATVSDVGFLWPPAPCTVQGQEVHVRFATAEFGALTGSFQWNGDDVDYDVATGAFLQTPTPSPTPSSTASVVPSNSPTTGATPANLPLTGGPPSAGGSSVPAVAAGVTAIVTALGAWFIVARGKKTYN